LQVDTKLLERLGVLLILVAALVPRVRDLAAPFDREFEGFQGSCFAAFCVNYERLGVGRFGGYPTYCVDIPDEAAGETLDPALYVYANHPPLVPLAQWAVVKALAPDGWNDAWRSGDAPVGELGIEPYLRIPTFAFHVLGLLAFWWMLREAGGPGSALIGLALLAMTPLSIIYAQLVNYENVSLFFVCVAYGFHARRMRGRPGRSMLWCTLAMSAACAVTFAPAFFAPPLVAHALARRGRRDAVRTACILAPACIAPLAVHALWVRLALPADAAQNVFDRVALMLGPLFSGELPFGAWLARQARRISYFYSPAIALAAAAGLVVAVRAGLARRRAANDGAEPRDDAPVQLGPALFAGGALYLLAFYRHTFDGAGVNDGQTMFLLDLAPGVAALAACAVVALARPLARLKGGIAPLVVVTSMIGLPGVARANELRERWRAPGPRDDPALVSGPDRPLPSTIGAELNALVPAGAVAFYPLSLGFNQAPGYYAWRTLIGVTRDTFGRMVGIVQLMGLGERDKFLVIPKDPMPAVIAEIGTVRDQLVALDALFAEGEHWEVWRLDGFE